MPELPEVQTTVNGLNRKVKGRKILKVSSAYKSPFYKNKEEIKNPIFFKKFKKLVEGQKIIKAERRAKNILIHLSNKHSILVHMKMTGHFVYDRPQTPFVRLDLTLDNKKHLVLSDMRKFAKVTCLETTGLNNSLHLKPLGPEPLDPSFKFKAFNLRLMKKPGGRIKQVLLDQSIVAGIGNIYADEILWRASVHPASRVGKIPEKNLRLMFKYLKILLKKGIALGGDSMDDYRNIDGEKGSFQTKHRAYQKHGNKCLKKGCSGVLKKTRIGGRGTHFCPKHQKLYQ